jgi:putative transcriptional regulator
VARAQQQRASLRGALQRDLSAWRQFRARLVHHEMEADPFWCQKPSSHAYWCHRIADAESGCILLANKPGMGFFERAVVLVVEHSSNRSLGLLLNRTAGVQIQDLAIDENISEAFEGKALRLGGCLNHKSIHILHGQHRVADAVEMCPGLFTGGLQSSVRLISDGICTQDDFSLLAGYTGWQAGQLDDEIKRSAWIPISCCPELVLHIACNELHSRSAWSDLFSLVSEPDRAYFQAF